MAYKREAYAGSSSDGTGEDIAPSTRREDARRTVEMMDGIFREVMPLFLMREDCLLLLVFDYDVTMSNVNKHLARTAFRSSFPSQRSITSLYPSSNSSPRRLSYVKTAQPDAYVSASST